MGNRVSVEGPEVQKGVAPEEQLFDDSSLLFKASKHGRTLWHAAARYDRPDILDCLCCALEHHVQVANQQASAGFVNLLFIALNLRAMMQMVFANTRSTRTTVIQACSM